MSWGKITFYAAGGIIAVLALMIAAGWETDESPKAKLTRIRDECDRNYGQGTSQAMDCFTTLISRFAIEKHGNDLDRIYRSARP